MPKCLDDCLQKLTTHNSLKISYSQLPYMREEFQENLTPCTVPVFLVFLVRIFPHSY